VFLINFVGVVAFGPWCVYRLGLDAMIHTPLRELGVMLAAGAMNLVGFLMVTKSLQMITVVRTNVINNGVVSVLTVLAGTSLFAEPWNWDITLGIVLSIAGTLLISLVALTEDAANGVGQQTANIEEKLTCENPAP
jgi:drug/metabolite transporter (DMT)-like permease